MTRARVVARVAAGGYALLVLGAVMTPVLVLHAAAGRGGLPADSLGDVLAVSLAVGGVAAARAERRGRSGRPGRWGGELAFLGLLTPLAAGLPALALHTAAGLPADVLATPGLVAGLWGGSLVAALLAASGARRLVGRWMAAVGGPGTAAVAVAARPVRRRAGRAAVPPRPWAEPSASP